MSIPIPALPDIHPQVIPAQPDPASQFLQALLAQQEMGQKRAEEQGRNARSDAEQATQQAHLKFLQSQEQTKQAALKHQMALAQEQGKAFQSLLEYLGPRGQGDQLAQMGVSYLGSQQPPQSSPRQDFGPPQMAPDLTGQSASLPQALLPAPSSPPPVSPLQALAMVTQPLSPEAAQEFSKNTNVRELIDAAQKQQGAGAPNLFESVHLGDKVTVFRKDKGFWDDASKTWKPSLPMGLPDDVKAAQNTRTNLRLTNIFTTATKALADRAPVLAQTLLTLKSAEGNPTLYSSAITNFVQAADQKAQMRIELLKFFKDNVDPSLPGKWNVLRDRLISGTLPEYSQEAMTKHIQDLVNLTQKEFETRRAAEVKRHPDLDTWLPTTQELFVGSGDVGTSVNPTTSGLKNPVP